MITLLFVDGLEEEELENIVHAIARSLVDEG